VVKGGLKVISRLEHLGNVLADAAKGLIKEGALAVYTLNCHRDEDKPAAHFMADRFVELARERTGTITVENRTDRDFPYRWALDCGEIEIYAIVREREKKELLEKNPWLEERMQLKGKGDENEHLSKASGSEEGGSLSKKRSEG
jgi:hypothetical protein